MLHSNRKRGACCLFIEKEPMQAQLLSVVLQSREKISLSVAEKQNSNKEEMIL